MKARRYSASQLALFRACRRKWWFSYPAGFKTPPGPSQLLGSEIHRQIEKYLLDGAEPADARAVEGLRSLASTPAGALHVEGGITIPLSPAADGTPRSFVGFIDLLDDGNPAKPVITDHKTTSDVRYAKTSYELAEDVQMLSYAKHAIDRYPEAVEVELRHNVIPTKGAPRALLTSTTVGRAHVESRWASYLPILAEMDLGHETRNAADVPDDGRENGECQKYGGCPHAGRCAASIFRTETIDAPTATSGEHHATKEGTTTMSIESLKDKLAAIKAASATGATKTEPKAPEATTASAPPTRALLDGAKASEPATEPTKPEILKTASDTKAKLEALRAKVKKSEPAADAPKKPEPEAEKAEAPKVEPVATTHAPGLAELAAREAAAAPHVTTTEQPGETIKVEVRGGQRAPGHVPGPVVETLGAYTQAMTEEFTAAQFEPRKGPRCRFLLLNALPAVGLVATPLEVFLEPVLETIRRETGKNWQMHAYREGTGMIVDGIARAAEHGLIPEVLAVDTTTALGKVAIEGLMHRADIVISGRAA